MVKITPRSGDEHLSLARLQHTHVVPLYAVQDFPEVNLRPLCMPFLGGTSWWHSAGAHSTPRRANNAQAGGSSNYSPKHSAICPFQPMRAASALRFLTGATLRRNGVLDRAVPGRGARLAHQRGLVHLDIKPSNVLLAGDGQPMLLDFHLAARSCLLARVWSTGSAAPRLHVARASTRYRRGARGTSFEHGLGWPLGHLLAGRAAFRVAGRPIAERRRAWVAATNAIVWPTSQPRARRRTAQMPRHDPDRRYGHAGQLAADLRRHLADLPLAGVPNRSLAKALAQMAASQAAGVRVGRHGGAGRRDLRRGFAFVPCRTRAQSASALTQGQQHLADRDYLDGIERFQAGLSAIRWFPWQGDLRRTLEGQLGVAKRAELAGTLHTVVERLRFVNRFDAVAPARLRELDALCERIWQARGQIAHVDRQQATAPMNRDLHDDLLDLAVLWSDLRAALVDHDTPAEARQAALEHLDEAERMCGPSGILDLAQHVVAAVRDGCHINGRRSTGRAARDRLGALRGGAGCCAETSFRRHETSCARRSSCNPIRSGPTFVRRCATTGLRTSPML